MINLLSSIWRWFQTPLEHKTLFWGFVRQEIRSRYAGSMGGMIWSVITPLANMLIYVFVFSVIFQIRMKPLETGTDKFVVFLLAGLLPWLAFAEAVSMATGIFIGKANLITKVAFPIEVLPVAGIMVTFMLNGIGFAIFLVYLLIAGYASVMWLALPVVIFIHMVFCLGLVILIASLCVFLRDIQQIVGTILAFWMYLTPILYPLSMIPENFRWMLYLNPMYYYVELYHDVLLRRYIDWRLLGMGTLTAILFLGAGSYFYSRSRNAFADVL